MYVIRSCFLPQLTGARPTDTFIGLNGLRILSVLSLLLVFSSNIVTLVHDVEAVNHFLAGKTPTSTTNATLEIDNDYIV